MVSFPKRSHALVTTNLALLDFGSANLFVLRLAIGIAVLLNAAAMTVEIEAELQLGRLRKSPVVDGVMGKKGNKKKKKKKTKKRREEKRREEKRREEKRREEKRREEKRRELC